MTFTLTGSDSITGLTAPTVHRLSNGLTIVAEQMPVEATNLSLWLGAGSAVESDDINGIAHYLEHMIFKGTRQLPTGLFERTVEQCGGATNAATSQDYTHYYITAAPDDFATLAPLQIEMVLNAAIPDDAFERERSVILEEIRRSHDNPRRRSFYRSMEAAFQHLPYRRPVLGREEVVRSLTAQQMREFHHTWYRPQSITAVAVGNLPVEDLVSIVSDGFDAALSERSLQDRPLEIEPSLTRPSYLAAEQPFETIQRYDYEDPTLQQARLSLMWRVPGMDEVHHTYALDAIAYILGQGRTARLVRDLREERKWVTSVSATNMTYARQGIFQITVQLPAAAIPEVEQAIANHLQSLQTDVIQDEELERVRTLVANQYIFGNETPSNRAGLYGYYHTLVGDLTPALNYPARIRALDAIDLQRAAQQYLSPQACGIVVSKPAS
ncbi:MAG TPA: pitrilysin family protein [Candidatus Obscuribacterales bacterium]